MRIDPVALLKVYQLANLTITVVLFIFPMKDLLALSTWFLGALK